MHRLNKTVFFYGNVYGEEEKSEVKIKFPFES